MAFGEMIRPGMDVYDSAARYVGMVLRVYPVPERFARGDATIGCFKPRHGLPYTCLHLGLAENWGWPTGISGTSAHMLSR